MTLVKHSKRSLCLTDPREPLSARRWAAFAGAALAVLSSWISTACGERAVDIREHAVGRCIPVTCESTRTECGPVSNGCGGALDCGRCELPQLCGGGGVLGRCGPMPRQAQATR